MNIIKITKKIITYNKKEYESDLNDTLVSLITKTKGLISVIEPKVEDIFPIKMTEAAYFIVPIKEFHVKKSVELFRKIDESFDKDISKSIDDNVIDNICGSLGNSPSAVTIVANLLRTESINEVIKKLREQKIEEFNTEIKGEELNIVKAIKLSFDTLKENEKQLLINLPALAGVINGKTVQAFDIPDVKKALGALYQKSLVERIIGNRYYMQTLTEMFARKELGEDKLFKIKLDVLNWAEKNNDDLLIELAVDVFAKLYTISEWDKF